MDMLREPRYAAMSAGQRGWGRMTARGNDGMDPNHAIYVSDDSTAVGSDGGDDSDW